MNTQTLKDYFYVISPNDIRIQGTRIGIETILNEYINCGRSPEEIAHTYPSLTLEQVYATILYYLQNQESVTEYMKNWLQHGYTMREQQRKNPPLVSEKFKQLRKARQSFKNNESQILN
ncbi:MAG: DUF433 domain-containing protein [Xenococcus sp. MO_188.B8]|nr:DUF433 domain-containing protein [Xenococcus sp. MO_188.B8]